MHNIITKLLYLFINIVIKIRITRNTDHKNRSSDEVSLNLIENVTF
jgi:hypothetical protein